MKNLFSKLRVLLIFLCFSTITLNIYAQVGINTDGSSPDPSAMLDVKSSSTGLLVPRMTEVQKNNISEPAQGLLIFQTNNDYGFYYNAGNPSTPSWIKISNASLTTEIHDANNDTKVQTEATANEDQIRFLTGGSEYMTLTSTGMLDISAILKISSGNPQDGKVLTTDDWGNASWQTPSGGGGPVNELRDADNDTKIQVEKTSDDDTIRFVTQGLERLRITPDGRLEYNSENVFFGKNAGLVGSSSNWNAFVGSGAGQKSTTAYRNTFMGYQAGWGNITGDNNSYYGYNTGMNNSAGQRNTYMGYNAGYNSSGSDNVFLGSSAGYNESGSNRLYIENSNADSTTALIYGEFDNNKLVFNGNVGINDRNPDYPLDVSGYVRATGFIGNGSLLTNIPGDNLGNHILSQNLNMGGRYLSRDGSNQGILFPSNGTMDIWENKVRILKYFDNSNQQFNNAIEILTGHPDSPQPGLEGALAFTHMAPGGTAWGPFARIAGVMEGFGVGSYSGGLLFQTSSWNTGIHDMIYLTGDGKMGVLTRNPSAELEVNGQVKITGGSPGAGKVLTSDANGLATWQNASAGGASAIDDLDDGISTVNSLFLGNNAGLNHNSQSNTGVGISALQTNQLGINNTAVGTSSLGLHEGSDNTGVGANTLNGSGGGSGNTAIGSWALANVTDGYRNTAVGATAMNPLTTGYDNVAVGQKSGHSLEDGNQNTMIGTQAGYTNVSGSKNVFIGDSAGFKSTVSENIYIGYKAGAKSTIGDQNTVTGFLAGSEMVTADNNTLYGFESGKNSTGGGNSFYGSKSGQNNVTGSNNTLIGTSAGKDILDGGYNTVIGAYAGYENEHGSRNVFVGKGSGWGSNGNDNIFIGSDAGYNKSGSDQLMIENSSNGNPLIYGRFDDDYVKINGNLGIGSNFSIPEERLHVGGNAIFRNTSGDVDVYLDGSSGNSTLTFQKNGVYAGSIGYNADDDFLFLYEGGNVVVKNGRMGIGTNTPDESLHVNGKLKMEDNIILNQNWLSGDGDDEGIYVRSGGNVGINTSTANSTHEINGSKAWKIWKVQQSDFEFDGNFMYYCEAQDDANVILFKMFWMPGGLWYFFTLPDATNCKGRVLHLISHSDVNALRIRPFGSQKINFLTEIDLGYRQSYEIISDGENWVLLNFHDDN